MAIGIKSGAHLIALYLFALASASNWIQYPATGYATMTHYIIPSDFVGSCGCTGASSGFPTAAMNQMAFGSSTSYGPACGKCYELTLLNTFLSDPPFYPSQSKSIVIKLTDLCPLSVNGWCDATVDKTNPGGHYINFDLVWPSPAIPDDFFPSNASLYGYTDFGVWNISYETVSCQNWAGWNDAAALGSVTALGNGGCCPADSTGNTNDTCPSYSDKNGISPDTHTSSGHLSTVPTSTLVVIAAMLSYRLLSSL